MFLIVVEWFLIVDGYLKSKTKANPYQIQNFTLFKKLFTWLKSF